MSWLAELILEGFLELLRQLWPVENAARGWRWLGLALAVGLIAWFFLSR